MINTDWEVLYNMPLNEDNFLSECDVSAATTDCEKSDTYDLSVSYSEVSKSLIIHLGSFLSYWWLSTNYLQTKFSAFWATFLLEVLKNSEDVKVIEFFCTAKSIRDRSTFSFKSKSKIWHLIVCWFLGICLFLPVLAYGCS